MQWFLGEGPLQLWSAMPLRALGRNRTRGENDPGVGSGCLQLQPARKGSAKDIPTAFRQMIFISLCYFYLTHFLSQQNIHNNQTKNLSMFRVFASKFSSTSPLTIKPLIISAHNAGKGMTIASSTEQFEWQVNNPLESLLGALVACEWSALQAITRHESSLEVRSFKIIKAESGYNLNRFVKGGKDNIINDVLIEAEIESNGTQEQLNALEQAVKNSCPIYQMLTASGVKITNTWNNKHMP